MKKPPRTYKYEAAKVQGGGARGIVHLSGQAMRGAPTELFQDKIGFGVFKT